MKFSIAVQETEDGKINIIAASGNADVAIAAYRSCDLPGKIHLATRLNFERSKRNKASAIALEARPARSKKL